MKFQLKNIKSYTTFFIVLISLAAAAQVKEINFGDHDRSYFGEVLPKKVVTFQSDSEAEDVVKKIVGTMGLIPNFEIRVGGINNAAAVIENGKRWIIYDQYFIRNLTQQTGTKWAAISIMAHEVGHHLNGHTLDGKGSRPAIELEADLFSGHVLQKMGATLAEARKAMEQLGRPDASQTHPAKHDRLAAITNGWIKSCNTDLNCKQVAKSPSIPDIRAENKQSCPAGQILNSDKQGGIERGEGYCRPYSCINGIDVYESNRVARMGHSNPDGSPIRIACLP